MDKNCSVVNETALELCLADRGSANSGPPVVYDVCENRCVQHEWTILSQDVVTEESIYGRTFPILVVFVIIANVLVALVLSKRHMVTPTNVVLKYMAIADLFVGLTPLPWTLFYFTFRNFEGEGERVQLWWCYVQKNSMDGWPPIFHNCAMWLTVLLAGQRFISISYPLYSRSLCNTANVRKCTVVIVILSLIFGLPKTFDMSYHMFDSLVISNLTKPAHRFRTCYSENTAVVKAVGVNAYYSTYFLGRAIIFVLIPSVLLIGLNAGLIRGIRKAQQRKERLLREKRSRDAQRQNDSNSTSIMLVIIVSIFLIVNLPQAVFMVIACLEMTEVFQFVSILGHPMVQYAVKINNMLVMGTYPINFAIYCFMSSSFRQTFRSMFCRRGRGREETNSSYLTDRKLENSAVPLVKFPAEDTLTTADEQSFYRREQRRNDSVYL